VLQLRSDHDLGVFNGDLGTVEAIDSTERELLRLVKARAELATAVALLSEMEMAFWLPEAEAELAQLDRVIETPNAD
jgi:ATP-dependent exoDNAse (exonuclease V) alpha subunit